MSLRYLPSGAITTPVDVNGNGDNIVIPLVAGQRIVVYGLCLIAAGAVSAKFYSGPSSGGANKLISGTQALPANGGMVRSVSGGWFVTDLGDALTLNLSSGVQIGGEITFAYLRN